MNIDGSDRRRLLSADDYLVDVVWSPEGQRLALTMRQHWGQFDGRRIAFVGHDDEQSYIYVINADGGDLHRLAEIEADRSEYVWSPDSQKLAYVGYDDWSYTLYVIGADGAGQRLLTDLNRGDESGEVYPSNPIWSADGHRIIFSTYEWDEDADEGMFHIYGIAVDGALPQRLTPDQPRFALVYNLAGQQ
jgi:TolB protein